LSHDNLNKENLVKSKALGWIPDVPDFRDNYFTLSPDLLDKRKALPPKVDLRDTGFFNFPLLDQGNLGSCTANAISAAVTFAMLKQGKTTAPQVNMGVKPTNVQEPGNIGTGFFSPSRLFIYYNERVKINTVNSDSGAVIRDGIKSLNTEGAPKETTWPYDIPKFTQKPPQAAYDEAQNYQAVQYRRLLNTDIKQLKGCLVQGFPFVLGFAVYSSFMTSQVAQTGIMPMPQQSEKLMGGHAVLCVGYDDAKKVFIIRNSWGDQWGDKGYFYMPYSYATNTDLATDFWTITMMENQ
jgi:C1A family cysteine protease